MSFDVESLFTNVLIKKTINVIFTRICNDHTISTNLKRRSLKKLVLDTCTKTAFSFNNIICKQKDGVSMGSSLGPIIPSRPNPGRSEKIKSNFYFHTSLWCLKKFYKGLKSLHKSF